MFADALEGRVLLAAEFVAELNPGTLSSTPAWQVATPVGLRPAGGRVFFVANDAVHGDEVWSSDGTAGGTSLSADVSPGPASTRVEDGLTVGNLFYFIRLVDTPLVPRHELWRTDGTPAGTFRISEGGYFRLQLTEAIGQLAFTAPFDEAGGYGFWLTDGTPAGTRLLAASDTLAISGTPDGLVVSFLNGMINRYDGTSLRPVRTGTPAVGVFARPGYALLKPSGSPALQIVDTATGSLATIPGATDPRSFEPLSGNRVAFVADNQPWVTDGTVAGTKPIRAPGGGAFTAVLDFAEMDGALYFAARPPGVLPLHGALFKVAPDQPDATATLVVDVHPDVNFDSFPNGLTPFDGRLYFRAASPGYLSDVWSTDGTAGGTRLELDLRPRPGTTVKEGDFAVTDGRLLFLADLPLYGRELYQLDRGAGPGGPGGASSYHVVYDVNRAGASAGFGNAFDPRRYPAAAAGGKLFFTAVEPLKTLAPEPYVTDGTAAGTRLLKDINPIGDSSAALFTPFGHRMYFRASSVYSTADAGGLWTSDGTAEGTRRVGQFASVVWIVQAAGKLFVGTFHDGVWVVDSPGAAPRELRVAESGGRIEDPMAPAEVGGQLYFTGVDFSSPSLGPTQLFRADGTGTGAVRVTAFTTTFRAGEAVAARGQYFFNRDGELWASDGTAAGTRRLGTFPAGELEVAGDVVYCRGGVLARSDGTPAGTFVLGEFEPNVPDSLTAVGDRVFFAASEPYSDPQRRGRELWTSDGTVAGTRRVKDILPDATPGAAARSSDPSGLFEAGGLLYFTADDGVHGRELWQSDGTAEGTTLAQDIYAGPAGSSPTPLGRLGDDWYFAAADFDHGRELWRLDARPASPTVTAVYLSGSAWTPEFKQALAARSLGSADFGFAVPGGATQLAVLPWTNLNQLSITFDGPVRIDATDLRIRGTNVADYTLDPGAFAYDPATRTATWRLANDATFGADRILLDLDGDSPDGVRGASGVFLDGDWINPVGPGPTQAAGGDAFPSGDGTPGGDFRFRVNVLPGDVDRSGTVLANDFSDVKKKFFATAAYPGTGDAAYSAFHDVTGSGSILADDFSEVKKRFFNRLPDGPPATAPLRAP